MKIESNQIDNHGPFGQNKMVNDHDDHDHDTWNHMVWPLDIMIF